MKRLVSGFWCDWSDAFSPAWRYVSLANGEVWEQSCDAGAVRWDRIARTVGEVREMVGAMRATGWELAAHIDRGDDAAVEARESLGAYPQGMLAGGFASCSADVAAGWRTNEVEAFDDMLGHAPTAWILGVAAVKVADVAEVEAPAKVEGSAKVASAAKAPVKVVRVAKAKRETLPAVDRAAAEMAYVPVGKAWHEVPELVALAVKPRVFGRLHHRVAYVFAAANRVVVAWKDGYSRGSDAVAESLLKSFVSAHGAAI